MVETAACTATPTSTQTTIQAATTRSLTNWVTSRAGVVAYGEYRDVMPSIPTQIGG